MYDLLQRGRLGNTLRMWDTLSGAMASDCELFGIRSRAVGGPCRTMIQRDLFFLDAMWFMCYNNIPESALIFSESPAHNRSTLQGELCLSERHYELTYTLVPLPTREAMATSQNYATGLAALHLLKRYMDPASLGDVSDLLDTYDDAVVEFSCFDYDLGRLPHRNTIIWEVRNY